MSYLMLHRKQREKLYKEEIRTVGQLLELVSGKGWRWLLKMEGVGRISYDRLLSNL